MIPPESSQISKSQSDSSASVKISNPSNNSFLNKFTLLIDQITQQIRIPSIIYYIASIMLLFQLIEVSMWSVMNPLWPKSELTSELVKYLHMISCLSPLNITNDNLLLLFVAYTVVFVLVIGIYSAQMICYSQRRRFFKITLYTTRLFLEIVPAIFIMPSAAFTGKLYLKMFENNIDEITVAFFAISLVETIGFSVFYFMVNSFIGYSAYLCSSPWAAFDLTPLVTFLTVSPYFQLSEYVAAHFPEWVVHPIVLIHIIFVVHLLIKFSYRPIIKDSGNIFWVFCLITELLLDLMRLALNFLKKNDNMMNPIAGLICFVLFLVIGIILPSIFFTMQTKKMRKHLMFGQTKDYTPTDEEKEELFMSLKLDTSENKAIMYFNFIIAQNIQVFLDFFPAKYIISHFRTNKAISVCVKIMAYFPSQSRSLSIIHADMARRRSLNFKERFLLYQIQKVKLLRQSSSSSTAIERLKELKNNTRELESSLQSFWYLNDANISLLSKISNKLTKSKALWEEALTDFPNSIPYRDEYGRYFVECETNFTSAVLQKHISDLIETGRNFNVDMCFKQFIRNFPAYLKKNILDLKGNFNRAVNKRGGSQISSSENSGGGSGNSNNYNTSSSSFSELDIAMEEGIGKSIITHSRTRLALQRTTESRRADSFMMFLIFHWILFGIGLACSVFIFAYFSGYFNSRQLNNERLQHLADTRLFTLTSILSVFFSWGNRTNVINIDIYDAEFRQTDKLDFEPLMDINMNWEDRNSKFGVDARNVFNLFITQIADLSDKGTDVFFFMKVLFEESTPLSFCSHGEVSERHDQNLKTALSYLFISTDVIVSEHDLEHWYTNNTKWCTIMSSAQDMMPSFDDLKTTMTTMAAEDAKNAKSTLMMQLYLFTFGFIFICLLLSISSSVRYILEINSFVRMLLKLPSNVKKEASHPLRKDSAEESESDKHDSDDLVSSGNTAILFIVVICIVYAVIGVLFYFQFDNISHYNTQYQYLNLWMADSLFRKPILIEICLWIAQLIVSTNPLVKDNKFVNMVTLEKLIDDEFAILDRMTKNLLVEGDGYPSAAGIDSVIDDVLLKEDCVPNSSTPSYHEMYRCGSAQQLMNFFMNTVSQIQVSIDTYNGFFNDEVPSSIVHLSSSHLVPKMIQIDDRFALMVDTFKEQYEQIHLIFFVVITLINIINIIITMLFLRFLNKCYGVALGLLRRVAPVAVVADANLVNYLLESNKKSTDSEMSMDQGIIHNSASSVLCIETNGVVDIINPAVTKTFGFSPEQLLGQSFLILIDVESRPHVLAQLELMIYKQSAMTYEDNIVCTSDDDSKVPCAITILGMTVDNDEVTSFVVLLRDVSLLLEQQEEAEKAKKESETLLYHILPRDIVIRLNAGEKDISFSVPSSTIMFIDIVKFSDYALNLTPQEIMGNLSLLFAGFDEAIVRHELLLKIKLIGDVYMCAGGLFTPDEPPVNHAEHMLRFSLECLQVLEDTNVKLNAVLNVRIGINTGGPLIAGVLGTDKPTFDIIGDPINIASRLQSTDIPGRVQISQATYDLVKEADFLIEPRGEVYLKGKGNQMAYLVSHVKSLAIQISSMEGSSSHNDGKSMSDLV